MSCTSRPLPRQQLVLTRTLLLHQAIPERQLKGLAVQVLPNEHHPAAPRLAGAPGPVGVALKHHVHALEHKALREVLDGQDALHAVDVLASAVQYAAQHVVDLKPCVEFAPHRMGK